MSRLKIFFVALLSSNCIILVSCRTSQPVMKRTGEPIPPNTCRVLLTVLSIDTTLQSSFPNDPCAKAPCRASVRVESVLGYGAAFTAPLSKGEVIQVHFTFTVAPTKNLFPTMDQTYPGVHVGTKFTTDLQSQQVFQGLEAQQSRYLIYGYSIQ